MDDYMSFHSMELGGRHSDDVTPLPKINASPKKVVPLSGRRFAQHRTPCGGKVGQHR